MIDYGLLVSVIIAFGVPSLLMWWWPLDTAPIAASGPEPPGFLDVAVGPAFAGLAVGRLVTLALDDPNSLGSLSDMLIIRSGVEFWPGVIGAAAVVDEESGELVSGREDRAPSRAPAPESPGRARAAGDGRLRRLRGSLHLPRRLLRSRERCRAEPIRSVVHDVSDRMGHGRRADCRRGRRSRVRGSSSIASRRGRRSNGRGRRGSCRWLDLAPARR